MIRTLITIYALIGVWSLIVSIVAASVTGLLLAVLWLLPYVGYRYRADELTTVPFKKHIEGS